jgi:hypothetical protein
MVFVPPFETKPEIYSPGSVSRVSRQASLISNHHTGTVDDTAIRGHGYVYPGDQRVIPPSCHESLQQTTLLTNLDEVFSSDIPQTQPLRPGRSLMRRNPRQESPPPGSSESSGCESADIVSGR